MKILVLLILAFVISSADYDNNLQLLREDKSTREDIAIAVASKQIKGTSLTQCNILSLSGGGAHGAFQAGVLKWLNEQGSRWDIITGISVGSLNGAMISLYDPSEQNIAINKIQKLWFNITADKVYKWSWNSIWNNSIYSNEPLNNYLSYIVHDVNSNAKRDILVGATSLNTGNITVFSKNDFIGANNILDIIMASTSIPVYFPPRFFRDEYFIDGGTFTNVLINSAVKLCYLKGLNNINIDVILANVLIDKIKNEEINKMNIFKIAYRTLKIFNNVISNHELYTDCDNSKNKYPMNIYKPHKSLPYELLDFNHKDIVSMFNSGYSTNVPTKTWYCI